MDRFELFRAAVSAALASALPCLFVLSTSPSSFTKSFPVTNPHVPGPRPRLRTSRQNFPSQSLDGWPISLIRSRSPLSLPRSIMARIAARDSNDPTGKSPGFGASFIEFPRPVLLREIIGFICSSSVAPTPYGSYPKSASVWLPSGPVTT